MNNFLKFEYDSKFTYIYLFVIIFSYRFTLSILNIFEFTTITQDSLEYIDIANSLKLYGVYGLDGVKDMNRTPTYPLFLLLINYLIGPDIKNIIFFQIIIDTLTCLIIFRLSESFKLSLFSKVLLIFLLSTCLYTISYTQLVMTETLYSFLICLVMLFICEKKKNYNFFNFNLLSLFYIALIFVLIILTRPIFVFTILFFLIFCFIYSSFSSKFSKKFFLDLKNYTILSFLIVFIMIPWISRNIIIFKDDIFSKNSIATPLGYKTNINMWKPFYMKEFKSFLSSYEEPFLMLSPIEPPVKAKYIYEGEKEDIELAFNNLNKIEDIKTGRSGKQLNYSKEIRNNFKTIAEKRHDEKTLLFITAPISRVLKILFAPRLSTFNETKIASKIKNFSGFNSNRTLLFSFMIYNFIYVFPALIFFIIKKNYFNNKLFFLFSFSLILSHIYVYTVWVPAPQSRYLIPLFPLFSLLTVITIDRLKKYLN